MPRRDLHEPALFGQPERPLAASTASADKRADACISYPRGCSGPRGILQLYVLGEQKSPESVIAQKLAAVARRPVGERANTQFRNPCRTEGTQQPTFVVGRLRVVNYICRHIDGKLALQVPVRATDFQRSFSPCAGGNRHRPPCRRGCWRPCRATIHGRSFQSVENATLSPNRGSVGDRRAVFSVFLEKPAFFGMSLVAFSEKAS